MFRLFYIYVDLCSPLPRSIENETYAARIGKIVFFYRWLAYSVINSLEIQ